MFIEGAKKLNDLKKMKINNIVVSYCYVKII